MPEYAKHNAVILGASFDTVKDNAAFAKKFDFPFPLLCDTDRRIGLAYGACDDASAGTARRISYVIGPDGTIRHVFPKVDAKSHPAQALELLERDAARG